jgi:glycosyltransferase involved in cell wall biosynthesis
MNFSSQVTAIMTVFNEESRISFTLKSFSWCNQIILIDKCSTDKTIEIAKKYKNVKIIRNNLEKSNNPFFDEVRLALKHVNTEWVMSMTASDLITKKLALKIKNIKASDITKFNCISLPYKPYFMGINESFSPWDYSKRIYIIRTDNLKINQGVHSVLTMSTKPKEYEVKMLDKNEALYHLTHENYEGVLDRYFRYLSKESNDDITLSKQFKYIIRQIIKLVFFKQILFKGKASVALTFSFLSYHMLKYVVLWDSRHGKGLKTYEDIREKISNEWN